VRFGAGERACEVDIIASLEMLTSNPFRIYSVAVIIQVFHTWDGGSTLPGFIFFFLFFWPVSDVENSVYPPW
jgi:hypothetical protein